MVIILGPPFIPAVPLLVGKGLTQYVLREHVFFRAWGSGAGYYMGVTEKLGIPSAGPNNEDYHVFWVYM